MKKGIILFFVLLLIQNVKASKPEVIKGEIDISQLNFNKFKILKLNGQWEFFEGEFIKTYPKAKPIESSYIKVPDSWNKHSYNGKIKNGLGYGSYRLIIKKKPYEDISLMIKDISSSYKVWVNNKLKTELGRIDTIEAGCIATYGKRSIALPKDSTIVEVVIEVANFCQHKGGIKTFISLIKTNQVMLQHERESLRTYFCLGIIIIMGFYHIFLYLLNRKERAGINFGLFCIFIFMFLLSRSRLIYYFYSDYDWDWGNRIEYISLYICSPLFFIFFVRSFPKQYKKFYINTSSLISVGFGLWVLTTTTKSFSKSLDYFHIVLLIYIILVVEGLIKASIKKESGIRFILLGFLIFMTALVNDILHVQNIINTDNYIIFGILGFTICQSLFLAYKSAKNNQKVIDLSINLTTLNKSLERFVPSDFMQLLGKKTINEVDLGNSIEREFTVMFSDIRAFTSISEKLSPEQSFAYINKYFKTIAPIIRRHNGFIDKYMGDGIMALFPSSANDAIEAGKAMFKELKQFNDENIKLGNPQIEIGVGLHTGLCILGTVGEPLRMDTTVISDSVNLASRIESLTKFYKTPMIISEETYGKSSSVNKVFIRYIGESKVKGKSIKTKLFKVFLDHSVYDIKLLDKFDKAISDFYNKDFEIAKKTLEELSKTNINDEIIELYLNLCIKYSSTNLPENWNTFEEFEY